MHCFVFFLSVFSVSHEKSNTNLIVIFYRWPFFSWRFSPLYPQCSLMFEDTSQHGYCIQQQNTVEWVQALSCVPDVEFWLWHLPLSWGSKGDDRDSDFKSSLSGFQFSTVAQSCPTLCDPTDCSTPGLSAHHQLLEFTQIHAHWVGDAIKPSDPPTFNLSQHQGLFKWVSSLLQVAKILEFQLQHQTFQWTPRTDLL